MNKLDNKDGELFDLSLEQRLRDKVSEHSNLAQKLTGKKGESVYGAICAIMDRIGDTIRYLNENHPIPGSLPEERASCRAS